MIPRILRATPRNLTSLTTALTPQTKIARNSVTRLHVATFSTPSPSTPPTPNNTDKEELNELKAVGQSVPKRSKIFTTVLRLFGYYGDESTRIRLSETLLNSCAAQSKHPNFFRSGRIRKDFKSRHLLTSLHVWILHRRLLANGEDDGGEGKAQQETLFDKLWDDTMTRIREQGIPELSVTASLKKVQTATFAFCVSLDHAQTYSSDREKCLDELGGALWREIYMYDDKISVDHVMRLAKYVMREQERMVHLEQEFFENGLIPWGPPPEWIDVLDKDGNIIIRSDEEDEEYEKSEVERILKTGGKIVDEDEGLKENWVSSLTEGGKTYWWNVETRESTWERPTK